MQALGALEGPLRDYRSPLTRLTSRKRMGIVVHAPNKGLAQLAERCSAGELAPCVDREFSLSDTPAALEYLGAGRSLGKLVIRVREHER